MWSWIACYVHGHDYSVCCESGNVFLRCLSCGRRSTGWSLEKNAQPATVKATTQPPRQAAHQH